MKRYYGDEGARNYARSFYSGKTWRVKSESYRKKHPFCERCLKRGIIEPTSCVHHKIHINKENYRDYKILLNSKNLESLCMNCHAKEHSNEHVEFEFEEDGTLKMNYEKE